MPKKKPYRVILDPPFEPTIPRELIRRAVIEVALENGDITQERADMLLREVEEEARDRKMPRDAAA